MVVIQPENNKMTLVNLYLSTLNVNGLNSSTKRLREAEWIKTTRTMNNKNDLTICCLQVTYLNFKDTHRLEMKWGERYFMKMETKRE